MNRLAAMPQNASGRAAEHDERVAPALEVHRHQQIDGDERDAEPNLDVKERAVHVLDLAAY